VVGADAALLIQRVRDQFRVPEVGAFKPPSDTSATSIASPRRRSAKYHESVFMLAGDFFERVE
jgi:hypothetical protein